MLNDTNVLIIALIGGILPALFWLWFWIREDKEKPEPKKLLFGAFVGGSIAVLIALFFELMVYYLLVNANMSVGNRHPTLFWITLKNLVTYYHLADWQDIFWLNTENYFYSLTWVSKYNLDIHKFFLTVIAAPIIEETMKLIFAFNLALRKKANDEPIDASIYLLTTALGFAAVETALFLTSPIANGEILNTLIATNFRSIGPMLIHLVSSAILGIIIGFAFYKNRLTRFASYLGGLILAIILHSIFNFFIVLNESSKNVSFFWLAAIETWLLVFILLVLFHKVKQIKSNKQKRLEKNSYRMV